MFASSFIVNPMPKEEISIFDFEEFSFGRKFNLLGRLYLSLLAKKLKHLGLERHFSVLILISEMGDNCCQKFIADTLHIDKTMMVGVLDDLSKKGFIKRTQNPKDRREYWIQLTVKGKKSIPEIQSVISEQNKYIMRGLTKPEVKRFHGQLEVIYKNLKTISKS
jgi:MarR family transcriptional regulator, transcriptional regulator for hemolysin